MEQREIATIMNTNLRVIKNGEIWINISDVSTLMKNNLNWTDTKTRKEIKIANNSIGKVEKIEIKVKGKSNNTYQSKVQFANLELISFMLKNQIAITEEEKTVLNNLINSFEEFKEVPEVEVVTEIEEVVIEKVAEVKTKAEDENNKLKIFENEEFGRVRTLQDENGKTLFCANDVASALGYVKPRNAIQTHCKGGALKQGVPTTSGLQDMVFIPEGDVYRLIVKSKLPTAEKFEKWVFDEVLPSIRKHGTYMTDVTLEKVTQDPDFLIGILQGLKEEQNKNKELVIAIEENRPKVEFADAILGSEKSIMVGELSKLLQTNNINIGTNKLFSYLREHGYLCKKGSLYNKPTQKSMDLGIMTVKEECVKVKEIVRINVVPQITPKGQQYFINQFLNA